MNYRRRFNLEEVLQEWEAEQGTGTPNGDTATSGEEGKNSSNTPSGKSMDEEEEEVVERSFIPLKQKNVYLPRNPFCDFAMGVGLPQAGFCSNKSLILQFHKHSFMKRCLNIIVRA